MKWKTANLKTRLYVIATVILLVGLGSSIWIGWTAANASDNTALSEFEGSNRYRHDLEVYGGTMNVIADQFDRWFAGLWQGESLAYTIASITVVISFGFFAVAHLLPSDAGSAK